MSLVVTNSSLTTFRACPRLYQIKYVDGYRPNQANDDLSLGSAIHKALESWWTDGDYLRARSVLRKETPDEITFAKADVMLAGYHHRWEDHRAQYEVIGLEVPFSFAPGRKRGVKCAGKIDGIVRKVADGTVWLLEHKTTGSDITPGSTYWQRVVMDSQVSMYFDGARALGHMVAGCIYDVLGKSKLRGKTGETPTALAIRIGEAMIAEPERYYQRQEILRMGRELNSARADISMTVGLIRAQQFPRNVDTCVKYGLDKACPFLGVCQGSEELDDFTKFHHVDDVHPELNS